MTVAAVNRSAQNADSARWPILLAWIGEIMLPDEIRVPLHSLQADIDYLFGRVATDGSCAGAMAQSVRDRLNAIEHAYGSTEREALEAAKNGLKEAASCIDNPLLRAPVIEALNVARAALSGSPAPSTEGLREALMLAEKADRIHSRCQECEDGAQAPEVCEHCFPSADDARVARRNVLKALGVLMRDVDRARPVLAEVESDV